MLLPRIRLIRGSLLSPTRPIPSSGASLPANVRAASHKAQGSVNSSRDGPGKRLGAKKSGEERVLPSQIIFRQRGTHWHAGHNAGLGRDHTIYALTSGYVKYYTDPLRHPTRKYIGVVFERDEKLPVAPGAATRRRLEVVPVKRTEEEAVVEVARLEAKKHGTVVGLGEAGLRLRPGGMYREANWEIGRVGDGEVKGRKVREFRKGDRFAAWRKTVRRKERNAEKRVGMGRGKGKRVKK